MIPLTRCVRFNQDMAELSRQFLQRDTFTSVDLMSTVTCVNVITGQPTYYQMFLNALSNVVAGDIDVMAIAEMNMAFDDSIAKHEKVRTCGFSTDAIPVSIS